jgi:hypothetical protein
MFEGAEEVGFFLPGVWGLVPNLIGLLIKKALSKQYLGKAWMPISA